MWFQPVISRYRATKRKLMPIYMVHLLVYSLWTHFVWVFDSVWCSCVRLPPFELSIIHVHCTHRERHTKKTATATKKNNNNNKQLAARQQIVNCDCCISKTHLLCNMHKPVYWYALQLSEHRLSRNKCSHNLYSDYFRNNLISPLQRANTIRHSQTCLFLICSHW